MVRGQPAAPVARAPAVGAAVGGVKLHTFINMMKQSILTLDRLFEHSFQDVAEIQTR